MKVLVDSNVLLDIFTKDQAWFNWSAEKLAHHAESDVLVINPIIYGEVSCHFSKIEELDDALPEATYVREPLPWDAGFLAGRCFVRYRRSAGMHRSPLPDFYIGAHAAIQGMSLLTRDARRYRTYFPEVPLICPQE